MMRKTWKKALSMMLSLAMVASSFSGFAAEVKAAEEGKVAVTVDGDSLVIGNEYISREFSTADDKLSTENITNKRTDGGDTVFTPAEGSEEFIIKVAKDGAAAKPVELAALDRTGWSAKADSYQNRSGASDGPASNVLDGNVNSIWHSAYNSSAATPNDQDYPHNLVINMGKEVSFKSFSYVPRQEGESTNGNILGYELYASTSAAELDYEAAGWTKIASGKFEYNGVNPIYVNLAEECTATQLKLVATSSNNGQNFAACAEFNLHTELAPVDTNTRSFAASALELAGAPVVEDTTAVINDVEKTGKKVTFSFKPYTYKDAEWTIKEVVVMYDGDHFMRKFMEIELSDKDLAIDYIDLESFNVNEDDITWTIPTDAGGVVAMDQFKANLGQPIYINGMFFGCEFPQADTEIVDGNGYMRYYTGKTFNRFEQDNQLTTDGKYVTWQTVAGAARSTENQVIQSDFFEYIYSIATPSDFRIQYNSWFDNMMRIDDENILESFIEIDRQLNEVETRPLDSYVVDDGWNNYNDTYVVDSVRAGTTLNKTGFWEFNSKFPEGLTPSSELVQKFGSNFGVWIGPRGGYNFQGSIADILVKSGKGSKAGGSIDVADREYVKNYTEMACQWMTDYGVNYWKWDGFADGGQYGAFPAADGVPGYSESNRHMTGGYKSMYHVTDLWEAWIDLMEAVRAHGEEKNINKLWISLTCYVTPSPWFLQWANSVWMQCVYDQKDASFGLTKLNKQLTYRDAMYYDFIVNHEFQFPLMNLYNHDPIYGKEGTGMTKNTATDDDFQNYLYSQSGRGTAFWELYFSDSIMTDGKYEVTAEFLAWAESNYHMLKNSKFIGGMPDNTLLSNGNSDANSANAYGYSCFDGTDGLLYLRNSSASAAKTIKFTFDRTMGVAENAGTLKYHLEHAYLVPEGTETTGELTYGQTYEITLQPNESRILRVSANGDQTAPEFTRAYSDGDKVVTVKFNEKVTGTAFTVSGAEVASVEAAADDVTFRITLTEALADNAVVEVAATDVVDKAGNACTDTISFVNYKGDIVAKGAVDAAESLVGDNGFTVAATVETAKESILVAQGDAYELSINADGYAQFTLNGSTAVSDVVVADGDVIVGVKENNGIQKIYVNGTLAGSAYSADNRFYVVEAAAIEVANATEMRVLDAAYGYDKVAEVYTAAKEEESLQITEGVSATTSGNVDEEASDIANIFDGDPTTYWNSNSVASVAAGNPNAVVDLGEVYTINQIDYSPRYHSGENWACTGNIKKLVLEVSVDGETWTAVTADGGLDISDKITKPGDVSWFPVSVTFEETEARYVRISATESYHWQEANANTSITIGDIAIFKAPKKEAAEIDPAILAKNAMANSEQLPAAWDNDGGAAWAFDDEGHWWHSRYDYWDQKGAHEVGSAKGDGKPTASNPIWIQTGFDGVYDIERIEYTGRDNGMGVINAYTVSVAVLADPKATPTDADFKVVKTGNLEDKADTQEIVFDEPVTATHVRITITSAHRGGNGDGHVAAQNISIFGLPGKAPAVTPTPEVTEAPKPTETEAPQPTETEAPQPTETEAPVPTETEAPQPTETEAPVPTETEAPQPSKDVTTVFDDVYKDWYTDYVQYVYDNGLMTGMKGTNNFAPNANITKAQVAQVLYNMEKQPDAAGDVFEDLGDVYDAEWYADAVAWAYATGVVTGDLNTKKFNPNADVTREQLALMMFRYAKYKGYDVTKTSDYEGLVNADKVNNWAAEGMSWAVGSGLISGIEKNGVKDLAPQGNASRAQVAAILQRFCENVAK